MGLRDYPPRPTHYRDCVSGPAIIDQRGGRRPNRHLGGATRPVGQTGSIPETDLALTEVSASGQTALRERSFFVWKDDLRRKGLR